MKLSKENIKELEDTLSEESFRVIRHEVCRLSSPLKDREIDDKTLGAFVRGVVALQRELHISLDLAESEDKETICDNCINFLCHASSEPDDGQCKHHISATKEENNDDK